jgi:hypothetical protein
MTLVVKLELSGSAERFVRQLSAEWNADVIETIGRAVWLLQQAHSTRRVALLCKGWQGQAGIELIVESLFEFESEVSQSGEASVNTPGIGGRLRLEWVVAFYRNMQALAWKAEQAREQPGGGSVLLR